MLRAVARGPSTRYSRRGISHLTAFSPPPDLPVRTSEFAGLPLRPHLGRAVELLTHGGEPLPIQKAAAKRVFAGESVAIHSQTGSGKTLAFLLPLLARLRPKRPRQVLIFTPTRELALQSYEWANMLQPASATMLRGTSAEQVSKSMFESQAPVLVGTSRQLGYLQTLLEPEIMREKRRGQRWHPDQIGEDGQPRFGVPKSILEASPTPPLLAALRKTLRTVVVDEADSALAPRGKGGMRNRGRRNRALNNMPEARALAALLVRDRQFEHPRVQLILVTATLSRRNLRDVAVVAGKSAGKIGLVVPSMAGAADRAIATSATLRALGGATLGGTAALGDGNFLRGDGASLAPSDAGRMAVDWDASLAALQAAEAAESEQKFRATDDPKYDDGDEEEEDYDDCDDEEKRMATAADAYDSVRDRWRVEDGQQQQREQEQEQQEKVGYGVRRGVLRQELPEGISHEMIICRASRKSSVLAALLGSPTSASASPSANSLASLRAVETPALVVVRDGLRMVDVIAELSDVGIGGAIELAALGTAAQRFHAMALAAHGFESAAADGWAEELNGEEAAEQRTKAAAKEAETAAEATAAEETAMHPVAHEALDEWAQTSDGSPTTGRYEELLAASASAAASRRMKRGALLDATPDSNQPSRAELRRLVPDAVDAVDADDAAADDDERFAATEEDARRQEDEEAHERLVEAAGMRGLREGSSRWRVIVAHESAVRGLDLPGLKTVVLTMLPDDPESYVHISGRTGRAGASGRAISVFTNRELAQAGSITQALKRTRWRMHRLEDEEAAGGGGLGEDEHEHEHEDEYRHEDEDDFDESMERDDARRSPRSRKDRDRRWGR